MPTYSYRCESCGVEFERIQKFADKPLTRCPECRTGKVRRMLQPTAIVFKGSGWYATDHRSASGQSANKRAENAEKGDKSETSEKSASGEKSAAGEKSASGEKSAASDKATDGKASKKEKKASAES